MDIKDILLPCDSYKVSHHETYPSVLLDEEFVDTWQEHCDHEAMARYDDIRERFASEIADVRREAAIAEREAAEHEAVYLLVQLFTGKLFEARTPATTLPAAPDFGEDYIPF